MLSHFHLDPLVSEQSAREVHKVLLGAAAQAAVAWQAAAAAVVFFWQALQAVAAAC